MKFNRWFASALTTTALAALVHTPSLAQQNWKMVSAAQPGSPLINFVDETVANITAGSKGTIKTERLFVGSEQEIAQQIVRGRV
ncbi:MAG: hypothetical protein NTV17_02025 [Burkholderiales bacterium]|nr:hypothetical protein [Burkholderiales bacterium]